MWFQSITTLAECQTYQRITDIESLQPTAERNKRNIKSPAFELRNLDRYESLKCQQPTVVMRESDIILVAVVRDIVVCVYNVISLCVFPY